MSEDQSCNSAEQVSTGHRKLPRGWHSRGYLPHFDGSEITQSVCFRLADSLPQKVVHQIQREIERLPLSKRNDKYRKLVESHLDRGYGDCLLKIDDVAEIVEQSLLFFHKQRYVLSAWCIMPNHVHVLATQINDYSLSEVVHSWKSFTAHTINGKLARQGAFWMADYFDRYIRDEDHFHRAKHYIENNPCTAGLCQQPTQWKWSSARRNDF